jgi:hypothetical protein
MDLYLRIERAGVSLACILEFLGVGKGQEEQPGKGTCLPCLKGTRHWWASAALASWRDRSRGSRSHEATQAAQGCGVG